MPWPAGGARKGRGCREELSGTSRVRCLSLSSQGPRDPWGSPHCPDTLPATQQAHVHCQLAGKGRLPALLSPDASLGVPGDIGWPDRALQLP